MGYRTFLRIQEVLEFITNPNHWVGVLIHNFLESDISLAMGDLGFHKGGCIEGCLLRTFYELIEFQSCRLYSNHVVLGIANATNATLLA